MNLDGACREFVAAFGALQDALDDAARIRSANLRYHAALQGLSGVVQEAAGACWRRWHGTGEADARGQDSHDVGCKVLEEYLEKGPKRDAAHAANWIRHGLRWRTIDRVRASMSAPVFEQLDEEWPDSLELPEDDLVPGEELDKALEADHGELRRRCRLDPKALDTLEQRRWAFEQSRLLGREARDVVLEPGVLPKFMPNGLDEGSIQRAENRLYKDAERYAEALRGLMEQGCSRLLDAAPRLGLGLHCGEAGAEGFRDTGLPRVALRLDTWHPLLVARHRFGDPAALRWAFEQNVLLDRTPQQIVEQAPRGSPYHVPAGAAPGAMQNKRNLVCKHAARYLDALAELARDAEAALDPEDRALLRDLVEWKRRRKA